MNIKLHKILKILISIEKEESDAMDGITLIEKILYGKKPRFNNRTIKGN